MGQYPKWLQALELKAASALSGHMAGFGGRDFVCPWLRWYVRKHPRTTPEVVFILQDWGTTEDDQGVVAAMNFISLRQGDPTIIKLFANNDLKRGLETGTHCVMNAVWGVRPMIAGLPAKKTGYLGKRIHSAAWPIWSEAVQQLSPTQKVITAGAWSRFSPTPPDAPAYFEKWARWTKTPNFAPRLQDVGYAYMKHPCTW
jgi:hypothetical protein